MALEGRYFTWTLAAGEDLDDLRPSTGHLFRAVALDDGKIAQNGREAGGILLYGGVKGEHVTLGYAGILKFAAGERIEAGRHLTVRAGGYFTQAHPDDWVVGRCLNTAVASGAIGTGAFNFASSWYWEDSNQDYGPAPEPANPL